MIKEDKKPLARTTPAARNVVIAELALTRLRPANR